MARIYFIDVTNRDGVQTAHLGLSKLEKTMINMYLNEMGAFQSEFGFPTTRHESFYLQANLELAEMGVLQPIRLGGWIRAVVADVEKGFQSCPKYQAPKSLYLHIGPNDSRQISGYKEPRRYRKHDGRCCRSGSRPWS